jgi:hypothetical protein
VPPPYDFFGGRLLTYETPDVDGPSNRSIALQITNWRFLRRLISGYETPITELVWAHVTTLQQPGRFQ